MKSRVIALIIGTLLGNALLFFSFYPIEPVLPPMLIWTGYCVIYGCCMYLETKRPS